MTSLIGFLSRWMSCVSVRGGMVGRKVLYLGLEDGGCWMELIGKNAQRVCHYSLSWFCMDCGDSEFLFVDQVSFVYLLLHSGLGLCI